VRDSPRRSFHERNQHFLRSVDSSVCDSPASSDAPESGNGRVPITKDVPVLRVDHISIKSSLLGVRHRERPEEVSIAGKKSITAVLTLLLVGLRPLFLGSEFATMSPVGQLRTEPGAWSARDYFLVSSHRKKSHHAEMP
jgi:hypothetical protein